MEVHHEEVVETSEHCSLSFSKKVSDLQKFKFNKKSKTKKTNFS